MGMPVVETQTSNTATAATEVRLTKPTDVAVGDVLLLIMVNDAANGTAQWDDVNKNPRLVSDGSDAGWDLVHEDGNGNVDCHIAIFTKVADGTEEATLDVLHVTSCEVIGWYIRVSGVDTTTIVNVQGAPDTSSNPNNSTHVIPSVTTTVDDCLAFYALAFDGGDGAPFSVAGTGWSESGDESAGGGPGGCDGTWGTLEKASFGATGDATVTSTASDKTQYLQFALQGAVAGGANPKGPFGLPFDGPFAGPIG